MAFDIQTTQRSLPGRGGGVAFQADLSTGQAQIAAATGALAGAVQNTAITLNRLQAENQDSEASRQTQEILDQFEDAISRELDSTLYPTIAKQAQERIAEISLTNKLAKRAHGFRLNKIKASMANTVLDVGLNRERDTLRADVESDKASGKFDKARRRVQKGVTLGAYSQEEGVLQNVDIDHTQQRRIVELSVLGENPEAFLAKYKTASQLKTDFPALTPGDFQDLRSMAQGQQRNLETDEKLRRREAVNAVGVEVSKLAATEGIEGYKKAQKLLLDNIEILGHDLFTTMSRNLQTTSKLYGETGINYYEVTHKPSVFWELDSEIKAGTLTDPAFIYQRTGANGISETDAARLEKRIPKQGGTANDFRNGAAATMFLNAYKAAVSNNLLLDEAGLGKELGLRWLEDSLQQHPDWTLRQVDEEALRIMERVQQAESEETLPTTADELRDARIKADAEKVKSARQSVWDGFFKGVGMNKIERTLALEAMRNGKSPEAIVREHQNKTSAEPVGRIIINPTTGERRRWDGTKWVTL